MKQDIYKFYVELEDAPVHTWRTILISGNRTLSMFGYTLMTLFDMQASHLFSIETDPVLFGADQHEVIAKHNFEVTNMFDEDFKDAAVLPAEEATISRSFFEPGATGTFVYDFGDNWRVHLSLEGIITDYNFSQKNYPQVLDGFGHGIVEDVGGVSGLADMKVAFENYTDARREYEQWLGVDEFDVTVFDADAMNKFVKEVPAIFKRIYELGKEPTPRMLATLKQWQLANGWENQD
jgi:hypothetical protein